MARRKKGGKTGDGTAEASHAGGETAAIVAACASMSSATSIAITELHTHAAPFLSFSQKARIAALATNFESSSGGVGLSYAPRPVSGAVVEGGLRREQIESIVESAVETALNNALLKIGATADEPIRAQVERQVEHQVSGQEHRLLEYLKKHLVDSLEMLEESLDARLADYFEGAEEQREAELEQQRAREEVEKQVEEAEDNLLQNIDEVRSIDVGFDISAFAASLSQMGDTEEIAGDPGDEGVEVELGGDEESEVEADDDAVEIAVGEDGDVELELGEDDPVEIELTDDDAVELELGDDEGADSAPETKTREVRLGDADPGVETVDSRGEPQLDNEDLVTLDLDVESTEVEVQAAPDSESGEATGTDVHDEEDVEEISIVGDHEDDIEVEVGLDEDGDAPVELELGDLEDEDDNPALQTLGNGPGDIESLGVAEISNDHVVEVVEDEAEVDKEDTERNIARYLHRAAEMRARKQAAAAMELYSKVLDLEQENYDARVGRGVVYLESKDYKRSVEEFTRAEKIDGSRPAGALGLAEVHFHRKQFNKAIRHYTRCLKLDDQLAQAHCNRGLSYYYQKNYKKAFLDLMRAYDLDSELPNIKKYLKLVKNKVKTESK